MHMYDEYQQFYIMSSQNNVFSKYCNRVYGIDFSQDGFNDLIEKVNINKTDTILDIGCGNGGMCEYIYIKTGAAIYGFDYSEMAIAEIAETLRINHKLKNEDDDDFTIRSMEEISSMMNTVTNMLTVLLASVAGISLLVGGIGIMNIMYVSVTERTREIGLRMSIGARGIDIMIQFLIESVLISVTGGALGVVFGFAISMAVNMVTPVSIQSWSVLLSFAVCTITGVFFGWYPAKKAANLDPIEAIRYE